MQKMRLSFRGGWVVLAFAAAMFVTSGSAMAQVNNQGTGDINGVAADLTDSNVFTLNTATLALVKAAFLTDGTPLSSGDTVPSGTQVQFLIYVDNTTSVAANNVNVQDALDGAFTYQANSIKVGTAPTGSTAAALYAAINPTGALDDGVDGTDVAGISGTTISAGSGAGNTQLNVAAGTAWGILFTVSM